MQFSLNKKISDKMSQNKDLSQCDIAISRQGNIAYSIACEALNVIASVAWQSPGRVTALNIVALFRYTQTLK